MDVAAVLKLVAVAKERELALLAEAHAARERALQVELEAARREAALREEASRRETALREEAARRELEMTQREGAMREAALREEALRAERARVAAAAAEARYERDRRALWLRSPEGVLRVLTMVVENGHAAAGVASLSRAFWGDELLWKCMKDRCGPKGQTRLMWCARKGDVRRGCSGCWAGGPVLIKGRPR